MRAKSPRNLQLWEPAVARGFVIAGVDPEKPGAVVEHPSPWGTPTALGLGVPGFSEHRGGLGLSPRPVPQFPFPTMEPKREGAGLNLPCAKDTLQPLGYIYGIIIIIVIIIVIIIIVIIIVIIAICHPEAAFPSPPCTESPRAGRSPERRSEAQGLEGTQPCGCWGLAEPWAWVPGVTSHPGVQPGPYPAHGAACPALGSWGAASRQAHPAGAAAAFPWQRCRMREMK